MWALADMGAAGLVLVLLGIMSFLSITILIARLIALGGVVQGAQERDAWLDKLEAGTVPPPPGKSTPADRVAQRAAALMSRDIAATDMSADLVQLGNAEVSAMGRGIRLLELIGVIAPLLGLLGTVLGMIQSFRSLELAQGAANASILAGGIWQALLTTAAGLIVAIPAVVGASILQARSEAGTQQIERVIGRTTLAQGMRRKDTT